MTSLFVCGLLAASLAVNAPEQKDTTLTVITLDDAVRIALSDNVSVIVADKEIQRMQYAKKGTYASLFPAIDASGSYQYTIKKQKFYADIPGFEDGMETGTTHVLGIGATASMPLINAQLWRRIKISGQDVELAVEKARGSRIETVSQVKQAFFSILLAREVYEVYKIVYDNAVQNLTQTQAKYNVKKASDLDLARAKTRVANAVPNLYDSESSIALCLWQLKAVMGVDLERNIDVAGSLADYAEMIQRPLVSDGNYTLEHNSSMKQLEIQAAQLYEAVKLQKEAYAPSLATSFTFQYSGMGEKFGNGAIKASPYAMVGLSLNIPIFSGGKRRNQVRQAKIQADEISLQMKETERQLKIAIRKHLNTMETATKSYYSAASAEESAQKAYDIANKSYQVGRSTLTDLNDAQVALTQAQLSSLQAIYSYLADKIALESVLGTEIKE